MENNNKEGSKENKNMKDSFNYNNQNQKNSNMMLLNGLSLEN